MADYPHSVSTSRLSTSQISHAVTELQMKHLPHEQSRLAAPGTVWPSMMMSPLGKGNVRRCWVEWRSSGRAHQASCGFECSESINTFNFELVEKPVNGIMQIILSICLSPSHRHFQKKTCFLPIRTGLPACVRARWISEVLLNRAFFTVRCCFCRGVSLTLARTSLEVARCASRSSAASTCHPFASRDPMFSCSVGEKVQYKPQKLLLASIKPPWKFKAFHKV